MNRMRLGLRCHRLLVLGALGAASACAYQKPTPEHARQTLQTRTGADDATGGHAARAVLAERKPLADTYVITVTQVVDLLQQDSSPQVREYAQQLKTFVGTTAYALAASPNPEVSLIDLAVNVSVHRRFMVHGLADRWFEGRGTPVLEAYASVEDAAWKTLARVYTGEQIAALQDGVERWWAANELTTLQFVRLPDLAKYRDLSLVEGSGSIRLLQPVAEASKTAMELRLLGQRSLFIAQRYPYIVKWHGEEAFYDTLATPEVRSMIRDVGSFAASADRLADVMEQLPNTEATRQTLAELRATLREAVPLLAAMRGLIGEWKETVRATNGVLGSLRDRGAGGGAPDIDVSRYTAALRELGAAARDLDTLLRSTTRLVESPALTQRLGQVRGAANTSFGGVADLGNHLIDRIFWRALLLIAAFFAALLGYRVAAAWIVRRP